MEHHLHHPSAPNGARAASSRSLPGSIHPSYDSTADRPNAGFTEAPRPLLAAASPLDPGRLARLFALLAVMLLSAALLSRAGAELPAYPLVSDVPSQASATGKSSWDYGDYSVKPLARYDVTARVLSARSYSEAREAEVSPIDFALGWGRMAERDMLSQLSVKQRDRWYFVRWRNAPVKATDVISNSANTHLIPATPEIAEQLKSVAAGDVVRLQGYLVKVTAGDGWSWTSSTSRTDTGDGSCEVLWVESVEVFRDAPITYAAVD